MVSGPMQRAIAGDTLCEQKDISTSVDKAWQHTVLKRCIDAIATL